MRFQGLDWNTGAVLFEGNSVFELQEQADHQGCTDWNLVTIHECRSCESEQTQERYDHYGNSTGQWCDPCYNSSKYPYRKDAYDPYNEEGSH
jgi:hypothetical protein